MPLGSLLLTLFALTAYRFLAALTPRVLTVPFPREDGPPAARFSGRPPESASSLQLPGSPAYCWVLKEAWGVGKKSVHPCPPQENAVVSL